jgi:hypothetical protein
MTAVVMTWRLELVLIHDVANGIESQLSLNGIKEL